MDCPSNVYCREFGAIEEEVADMAASEAIERLAERLDDIRASQTTFAVEQARVAGKLEAMEAQLTGIQRTFADVNTLREHVTRLQEQMLGLKSKELRGWIEKLVMGAIGAAMAMLGKAALGG